MAHFHESSMVEGMEKILQPAGYLLNICVTNESHALERAYMDRLVANRVDAICISLSQETYDKKRNDHIDHAISRALPLIFMDRFYHAQNLDQVITDDYQGAFMATEHLIQMGCRRIAHLHGPKGITVSQQRFQGYLDCLRKYDLPLLPELIAYVSFSAESAVKATMALLDHRPDGIFGVNDEACFGAMKVIREKNIRIPEDIALVGFDDIPLAQFAYPPLSSVSRQSRKIGEETAQLFLAKINGLQEKNKLVWNPNSLFGNPQEKGFSEELID